MLFVRALALLSVSLFLPLPSARAAPNEADSIRRLQLEVVVCDKKDAATNDPVKVSVRGGHSSYLNYPHNDFNRNSTFTYDLTKSYNDVEVSGGQFQVNTGTITTLADISRLHLSKAGDNGLCVKRVALLVNQQRIFEKTFPDGKWLDKNGTDHRVLRISASELRAGSLWQAWTMNEGFGVSMPESWLIGEITANVAKEITGDDNPAYWRTSEGAAVRVRRGTMTDAGNTNYVHVQVNLRVDTPLWPDRDVTLTFDIRLSKKPNGSAKPVAAFEVVNFQGFVDPTWAAWIPILNLVDTFVHLYTSFKANQQAPAGTGAPSVALCPTAPYSDGTIEFAACDRVTVT